MINTLSFFDTILILLLFLSAFFAMLRGFTRETLAILSWAFAALASFVSYTNNETRSFASNLLQPDWLAYSLLVGITFITVLIVSAFLSSKISKLVLKSNIGILDRIFGIFFGILRGYLLILVFFIASTWFFSENEPDWLVQSIFYDYLESSKERIYSYLPDNPSELIDSINLNNLGQKININDLENINSQ